MSFLRRLVTVVVAPLALLLATGLLAPEAAMAHEGDPNIQTVIEELMPALPGVSVSVIQGSVVPSLEAYNPTATELQVLGTDGVPFLRRGRSGTLGNAASPDLYLSEAPSGAAGVPPGVRAGAPPRWIPLSRRPGWTWFDQRLPAVTSAPPAVRGRPAATLLGRFAIPLRYGGSSVKAEGVVSYVPPAGGVVTSLTSPMQPALGLTVALLPGRFPDVYLQNSGTTTVTVLGEGGEPFAQIGPQGVRVNLRSPIHDADLTARGQTPRVRTDLSAAPLWQDVSATPSYDWFDPRPHFLPSWTIPLHLGARTIPVQGVQRFAAPTTVSSLLASRHAPHEGRHSDTSGILVICLLAAGVLVVVGGASVRRRRPRAVRRTDDL